MNGRMNDYILNVIERFGILKYANLGVTGNLDKDRAKKFYCLS